MEAKIAVGEKGQLKDCILVDTVEAKEPWSEYHLSDGSIIKMRSILVEIWRVKGEFDNEGNPVYVLKAGDVLNITPG